MSGCKTIRLLYVAETPHDKTGIWILRHPLGTISTYLTWRVKLRARKSPTQLTAGKRKILNTECNFTLAYIVCPASRDKGLAVTHLGALA
jgi:hypothetical protein